jgi:hypothetical protein
MAKDSRSTFPIIDDNGCPVDPTIFPRYPVLQNNDRVPNRWMAPALLDLLGYRLGKSSLEEEAVKDVPYRLTYQNLLAASVFNNRKCSTVSTSHFCLHTLSKYRTALLYCLNKK